MITIGELARYAGVSRKTIRVYHAKGLLPEPDRDASGYRRYTAHDVIEVVKIRTLANAGVPLARIRELRSATDDEFGQALRQLDNDLTGRIRDLRDTKQRLRDLALGRDKLLPPEVARHVKRLREIGLSQRWIDLVSDLWILVFATHPDTAAALINDQDQQMADPVLRQIFLDYDRAHDLDPDDPAVDALAQRMIEATRQRYPAGELPGQDTGSEIPALIQAAVNDTSAAWQKIDTLVREQLQQSSASANRDPTHDRSA
jgi:DNA-binding transcriptional MerR regulator